MKQKRIWNFSIGLGLAGVMVMSVPVFAAKTFTSEQAKALAAKAVPKEAVFVQTKDDEGDYEFKFYQEKKQEWYEIDVDKATQKITSFDSKLVYHDGSEAVELNEEAAKKAVKKELPHAEILSVNLDYDDGMKQYEVKFSTETLYGEYVIHPVTGAILERDISIGKVLKKDFTATKDFLSREKIKAIALEKFPKGTVTDMDWEWADNAPFYEVEVLQNAIEYDMAIDAKSGDILWSDQDKTVGTTGTQKKEKDRYISLEEAKKIVLAKVPGASLRECELDHDDGFVTYEGKLYKDGFEYEFKLDAETGTILEWEKEWDD